MIASQIRSSGSLIAVIALTLLGGVVHGRLNGRWGGSEQGLAAGAALQTIPTTIGDWEVTSTFELRESEQAILQTYGHIGRIYRHRQDGRTVTLSMYVAPKGPAVVHTPEICLTSIDYRLATERSPLAPLDTADRLWTLTFRSTDVQQRPVRVVYGWRYDSDWIASPYPRFSFAGYSYLTRMNLRAAGEDSDTLQSCQDFLRDFLPALEKQPDPAAIALAPRRNGN